MGFVFSKVFNAIIGNKEKRFLLLGIFIEFKGLDNAGKTTILYKLHLNEVVQTVPTIGFNVESVTYKNLKFEVWDLGGQTGIRFIRQLKTLLEILLSKYKCHNICYRLIRSSQTLNIKIRIIINVIGIFFKFLEEELKNTPLLVLANKQDLVNSMPEAEISEYLGMTDIQNRQWAIFKCSAVTGFGLNEGMEWLTNCVKD